MNKLIVVIMGPGKKHFAEMCLDSVKDADKILYWTSRKNILRVTDKIGDTEVFKNGWDETDPATNGKCRNRYLEHLKENYPDDWCLVLDEDELLENLNTLKEFIQIANPGIYNVKMRHLIGNLGWEDATSKDHLVPGRLFKISKTEEYPEHSHPVLKGNTIGNYVGSTIWHLGHLPVEYMDYILTRYKQHSSDSQIHTPEFLKQWKLTHLLGQYPVRQVNPVELPKQILERYELDRDEFYHSRYQLELKHSLMVKQWNDYFKPESVKDIGCGRGCYLYFWKWYVKESYGLELSQWAVDNGFCEGVNQCDIGKDGNVYEEADLVTAIDVLEHLNDEQLSVALKDMSKYGKQFLFSIPFKNEDENLYNDNTHKQFLTREEWLNKLKKYDFKILETPKDWLFSNQIIIAKK